MTKLPNPISSAFVTGATGLLGNNLVRLLAARAVKVKALVRSREKARSQFQNLAVEIVEGDLGNVPGFAEHLRGTEVLFHTAAYFRDSYKGGRHREELLETNVQGTAELLSHAYSAGIRRVVHTSSSNVVTGPPRRVIDETMSRPPQDADDYALSKILSEREIHRFLDQHPDMFACMVLPGWIIGPGDMGPTASGQLILDFLNRKLPGVAPATFSVVDARDVAQALLAAASWGRRGERYLVAGRHTEMAALLAVIERLTGVPAPRRRVPMPALYALAALSELFRFITRKPTLISLAAVRFMARGRNRTHFSSTKSERELGIAFRPLEETIGDTISWYRENGWLDKSAHQHSRLRPSGEAI